MIFGLYFAFINYKLFLTVKDKVDVVGEQTKDTARENKYKKIGGWFILVAIGFFITLILLSL